MGEVATKYLPYTENHNLFCEPNNMLLSKPQLQKFAYAYALVLLHLESYPYGFPSRVLHISRGKKPHTLL